MKRIVSSLLCLALVFSLFALSGCGDENKKAAKKKGESHTLELRVDQNAGLDWFYKVDKKGLVKIEKDFVPDVEGGMQGKIVFTVTALKKGEVCVTFKRALSEDLSADSDAFYNFKIDKNLKFTEISLGGSYYDSQR